MGRYLILGATGTLGRATIRALLNAKDTESVTCLSRDELKQFELKKELKDDRFHFVLGDIRDRQSIEPHFKGVDTVFHFAALKRIPEMEAHPLESLKTNVLGTINAAECALAAGVTHFVFSSTDKACKPINTYGACKFLSEQILFNLNARNETNFSVYRWGNVLGSRGSVVHEFKNSIETRGMVSLTHENMTRFWIRIEDAVQFILRTYETRESVPKIPDMRSSKVIDMALCVGRLLEKPFAIEVIGLRPGEKIHEDITPTLSSDKGEPIHPKVLLDLVKAVI